MATLGKEEVSKKSHTKRRPQKRLQEENVKNAAMEIFAGYIHYASGRPVEMDLAISRSSRTRPRKRPRLSQSCLGLKTSRLIPSPRTNLFFEAKTWSCEALPFYLLLCANTCFFLIFLALEFFGCWLAFALIWWLIAFVHGDLHDDHLPLRQAETGWTPCILNIHGFHSAFLYSLETQHTTGYGLRVITEECPEAIFILVCQCLIGMTLDSFAISIVFAKLIRAKHATNTIQFSRNAVISHRDGKLCFMFRAGDLRRSRLAGVGVRAILVKNERTQEGEALQNYQIELGLNADGGPSDLFMLWPLIIYHEIDEDSPLYDFTAPQMIKNQKFEIIVVLDATVESTGVSIEAKSSYLSSEILFGHKFEPMVSYNKYLDTYETDWSKFDNTRVVDLQENADEDDRVITSESKLLSDHDHDRGCSNTFEEPISDATLAPLTTKPYACNEMLASEDIEGFVPSYEKPPEPAALDNIRSKRRFYQTQGSRFDSYHETISESDENRELPIAMV